MIVADWSPTDRKLRQFSGALLFAAVIVLLRAGLGWPVMVLAVGSLAGFVWPAIAKPVFIAATLVSLPIGWLLSHVLLRAIYYLVLTPVALLFRVAGRDQLGLRRKNAASHWEPFAQGEDIESYFRQT